MPFVSKQQMRACYAQKSQALKENKPVTWDCKKFSQETHNISDLPLYKYPRKLYLGPRGGLYYKTNTGRIVYVTPEQVIKTRKQ